MSSKLLNITLSFIGTSALALIEIMGRTTERMGSVLGPASSEIVTKIFSDKINPYRTPPLPHKVFELMFDRSRAI